MSSVQTIATTETRPGVDAGSPDGSEPLFQRPEWERVFGVYGLAMHRLTVSRGGEIAGALPLVAMKGRASGGQLVSLPWFDVAGLTAVDHEARDELISQSLELADRVGARVVQLRQFVRLDVTPHVRTDKVVMRLSLERNADELWRRFKPTVRNQVRKSEKSGLTVERGGRELRDEFFAVYSRNMRDLGSPSHSRRFFDAVLESFARETTIYIVRYEGSAVGCGLTMGNGATLEVPWASSLRSHNRLCVNHALYWRILSDACVAGFERFSFGRSTVGSGPYRFKKQWGAQESTVYWHFLSRRDEFAAAAAVPPQETFRLATRLWKRLPLWLTRRLGPRLMARFP